MSKSDFPQLRAVPSPAHQLQPALSTHHLQSQHPQTHCLFLIHFTLAIGFLSPTKTKSSLRASVQPSLLCIPQRPGLCARWLCVHTPSAPPWWGRCPRTLSLSCSQPILPRVALSTYLKVCSFHKGTACDESSPSTQLTLREKSCCCFFLFFPKRLFFMTF